MSAQMNGQVGSDAWFVVAQGTAVALTIAQDLQVLGANLKWRIEKKNDIYNSN